VRKREREIGREKKEINSRKNNEREKEEGKDEVVRREETSIGIGYRRRQQQS
jgi:hypothetical protein